MELEVKISLEKLQDADNIEPILKEEDSQTIGRKVVQSYETDRQSRSEWEKRMKSANDLALQVVEAKSYPWENAANVKFPLLTIASMQFAARAYPALIKAPDLVKYRVQGADPMGEKAARADRISRHMSYQLLEQDEGWEEDQDKAFIALPIVGSIFKKSYFDPIAGHNRSTLVLPKNLVVHYYARSLEECERKTEVFQLYEREIKERVLRKVYSDHELGLANVEEPTEEAQREGLTPGFDDRDRPRTLLEQHCYLDLDGDGYKEPYIVTVDKTSQKVLRIKARFKSITTEQSIKIQELMARMKSFAEGLPRPDPNQPPTPEQLAQINAAMATIEAMQAEVERLAAEKPKVLSIKPVEFYTKYTFIPSPDEGFYDLGLGALLGPLNESVNTLINQLLDSGSLQNGNMGFIGKGARIKGGKLRFSPNEWKRVDCTGGQLRDALVPLPVGQPSAVLFNLLSLLINYSERVGSVTDAMMGENPGQNTPAYNMSAMLEQGLQVFNGIFKRVYRSMRAEIRKLYDLNALYLDKEEYFSYHDSESKALQVDYTSDSKDLIPAADPNAFSSKEKQAKAQMISERSMQIPGYDRIKAEQRYLESLDIPDAKELFPVQQNPETGAMELVFPPPPNEEMELAKAEEQRLTAQMQGELAVKASIADSDIAVNQAKIIMMMAQASEMADRPEFKRLELMVKEMQMQRETLVKAIKVDNDAQQDKPGDDD